MSWLKALYCNKHTFCKDRQPERERERKKKEKEEKISEYHE